MKRPHTLFYHTASTITLSLLLLSIIFVSSAAYFVMVPVGKRSAEDLAALLALAAKTWVELPPATRPDFEAELRHAHDIRLLESKTALSVNNSIPFYIYLRLLKQSLQQRFGNQFDITLGVDPQHPGWVWINIPLADGYIRFGISEQRIGARPPVALIAMAIAIIIIAIGTSLILARRLTRPLEMLSRATSHIGKGEKKPLPENEGPAEIRLLARNFNRMAQEVTQLLENRSTLLAGISHDLRTPLTRLRLALEINSASIDDSFQQQIASNIEEMEQLLEQAMLLARDSTQGEATTTVDLVALLTTLSAQLEAQCAQSTPACQIHFNAASDIGEHWHYPLARQSLLRILRNLISNALRYGSDHEVQIVLVRHHAVPVISILDRGPGIPESERRNVFRAFYRLEDSRNLNTGGSGLGLAIVQQLCAVNGWKISMHARDGGGNEARLQLQTAG